ncbi:hypothetical protein [Actinoplanes sp. M2I2]|uniref:hypothetical protein n=1 Tax=Actinoplanes sp. M2I2 TaxID=1734444 RepID=UPI002021D07B|nr:hypothetical protein [Actinoplanes sp. M2I2]
MTGVPAVLRTAEARLLRAELRGDDDERDRILGTELSDGWWPEVMPVAFAIAALRRFGQFGDRRLVTAFARRFVERAPGAQGFAARTVEAVVRGSMSEAWLLGAVDPVRAGEIMYAGLFALADDLELDDDQVDGLLAEAEKVVSAVALPAGGEGAALLEMRTCRRTGQRYLTDADRLPDLTRRMRSPWRPPAPPRSRKAQRRQPPAPEPSTVVGRYLRALALREEGPDRTVETDGTELMTLALCVLVLIVRQYLPKAPDQREISALTRRAWETFRPQTDPITIEHMVRRALGEDIPVDDISAYDRYGSAVLVLGAIADDWNSDARAVGAVIAEAEQTAIDEGRTLTRA